MRTRLKWTEPEDAALVEALEEGASYREVAEELGRTRLGVACRGARLGMGLRCGRRPDPYKRARVLDLLDAGKSMKRIAADLGLAQSTVNRMVRLMVRDGLLRRVGERTRNVRYVPTTYRSQ